MHLKINQKIVLFISIMFSLLVGSKFYGFGHDYYIAYYESNVNLGTWHDRLGWRISTLTINNTHIGVHVVSFLLSLSFGILLKKFFKYRGLNSLLFFTLIYILGLHTWPIIMSTSNAMRQGITMSLVFISLAYLLESKNLKSFFFIFISIFTHKSGIIFLFVFGNIFIIKLITNYLKTNKYLSIFYFVYGVLICFFLYYSLLIYENVEISYSKIIQGDYRYQFVGISFIYSLVFLYKFKFLKNNDFILFLYLFCFCALAILLLGLNYEYERFMMMMLLPYMIIFCTLFDKKSSYLYLTLSFSSLLSLTIITGMYRSLA